MVLEITKEILERLWYGEWDKELVNQILKDHKKAGEVEWLYRKIHYLKRINKRLGEQLLDTDKRNIHIKPWDWKKICEKAKKYEEIKPEAKGMIKAFNWLQENQISKIPDHPQNIRNQKLRELLEQWNKDLLSAPLSVEAENWKDHEISDRIEELLRDSEK